MSDHNHSSDIINASLVFDYVSGDLSDSALEQFEARLRNDEALQREVEIERALREQLTSLDQNEADWKVSPNNSDALLARIDAHESQQARDDNVVQISWFRPKPMSIAASIMLAAVISVNFYGSLSEPKFETLTASAPTNSNQALLTENRLLEISLNPDVQINEIQAILQEYSLKMLELDADTGMMTVSLERSITAELAAKLKSDPRVKSFNSIDTESQ